MLRPFVKYKHSEEFIAVMTQNDGDDTMKTNNRDEKDPVEFFFIALATSLLVGLFFGAAGWCLVSFIRLEWAESITFRSWAVVGFVGTAFMACSDYMKGKSDE